MFTYESLLVLSVTWKMKSYFCGNVSNQARWTIEDLHYGPLSFESNVYKLK